MDPDQGDPKLVKIERYYRKVYQRLDPADLQRHTASWPHPEDEPEDPAPGDRGDSLFLDYYSVEGLRLALERYGFLGKVRETRLGEPVLTVHRHDKGYDVFRIRCARVEKPVVELVAEVAPLPPEARKFVDTGDRRFLRVRWLRMQNPEAVPDPVKPLLPGQDHPGLGLGREMAALLQLVCSRLGLDGVVEKPERLHNAALYFRRFRFLDPEMQGVLTAILRDTRDRPLADLAWGVEVGGLILRETGKPFRWAGGEQVLARTGPVLQHLDSDDYRRRAHQAMQRHHFTLNTGDLARNRLAPEEPNTAEPSGDPSKRWK